MPIESSTPAAGAGFASQAEPCRLTLKEVALLHYVSWTGRTGQPPPLTVYAEPSLQHVLRGLRQKQRQPLATPEDEVQVVADLINVPDADQTSNDTKVSSARLRPLTSALLTSPALLGHRERWLSRQTLHRGHQATQANRPQHMLAVSPRRGPDPGRTSPRLLPQQLRCPPLQPAAPSSASTSVALQALWCQS